MPNMIAAKDLVRQYGNFTAVKGITFDIKDGEIFSLLGPNGAGKTTTISMLSTLYTPTSGDASTSAWDCSISPVCFLWMSPPLASIRNPAARFLIRSRNSTSRACPSCTQRITDDRVSPTDPDSAPMQLSSGGGSVLGYRDHYVVDGGKARIILSSLVTPASIMDNTPILDLVDWVRSRWNLKPKIAVGDAKYGTVPNIVGLEERGIKAYLPTSDFSNRTKYYPSKLFQYDLEKNLYICPQGQTLPLVSRRKTEKVFVYKPKGHVCNACPVKGGCTGSKSGRHIFRSFFHEQLDKAEAYRQTEAYKKAMRKRSVWVEPLFGEAKEFHSLRRFRLRRLLRVNIEGVMVATGQNLKRLVKHKLGVLFSWFKTQFSIFYFCPIKTFSTAWPDVRGYHGNTK